MMFICLIQCSWTECIHKDANDIQRWRKETRVLNSTFIRLDSNAWCSDAIFSSRLHAYLGPTWNFGHGGHRVCPLPQISLGTFTWEEVTLVKTCSPLTCNFQIDFFIVETQGPLTSAGLISNIMERWLLLSLPGKGCVTMSSPGLLPVLSW